MVVTCPKCEARLKLDESKLPTHAFSVRCPKCQTGVDVQPAEAVSNVVASAEPPPAPPPFERPVAAPRYASANSDSKTVSDNGQATSDVNDVVELLAQAFRRAEGNSSEGHRKNRWDKRKVLVCASPANREVIAQSLADQDYDVFVAENMAQGLGRMREERMDVLILDANFDPLEQGVAFVTREVRLMRPSERRRLFFVNVMAGVRTMDPHAAFLQNVNLVVNPSDVEQMSEALEISIRHYNELYRDFNRALDLAPI